MAVSVSTQELVPVPRAARMVYELAYGRGVPVTHLADRLNGLAYRLADSGGVYTIEGRKSAPRRLSHEELAGAFFRNGGEELHFLDQRAPLFHLGVTQESIEGAVTALRRNQAALR